MVFETQTNAAAEGIFWLSQHSEKHACIHHILCVEFHTSIVYFLNQCQLLATQNRHKTGQHCFSSQIYAKSGPSSSRHFIMQVSTAWVYRQILPSCPTLSTSAETFIPRL